MGRQRAILGSTGAVILLLVLFRAMMIAARNRADSARCASSITSICMAARLWAEDHGELMPTNFLSMSNELNTPKVLSCLDARRASDWSTFAPENCTYQIVAPGMGAGDTNKIFLRCSVHGHLGYSDCTVFDGHRRRRKFD